MFACAGCGATLTAPVSRVALPVHAHQRYGHELLGPLMEPGTYAIDQDHFGPPWRRWAEIDAAEAEARGIYAPMFALSFGPRGAAVIAPGDVRGTVFLPERLDGRCCGLDGRDGPNLACERCGRPVATRIDDCGLWQAVWLDPGAVDLMGSSSRQTVGWEALLQARPGIPPVEPDGWWSPVWAAAIAAALARLLAVSAGARIAVPDGLAAVALGRALDILLPPGAPGRTLALAGPGLPAVAADIVLVPQHPQTGEHWVPSSGAADVVPLPWDIWAFLASERDRGPVPFLPDEPPPLMPSRPFRTDSAVFVSTLARLPEVRRPWLRGIYDRVADMPFAYPF